MLREFQKEIEELRKKLEEGELVSSAYHFDKKTVDVFSSLYVQLAVVSQRREGVEEKREVEQRKGGKNA
jgi:hypothetical protein